MGSEPVEKRVVEVGEGSHDGEISGVADVSDVLDAMGELRVGRERKDKGLDGRVRREERSESGEVFRGD